MNWDLSYEKFKIYGPDHPEKVNFEQMFPNGAFIAYLPIQILHQIIDLNSISLNESDIMGDIVQEKWNRLKKHVDGGEPLSPPWGMCSHEYKIAIPQGCHRFQYAFLNEEEKIPIVVNHIDAEMLSSIYEIHTMKMGR